MTNIQLRATAQGMRVEEHIEGGEMLYAFEDYVMVGVSIKHASNFFIMDESKQHVYFFTHILPHVYTLFIQGHISNRLLLMDDTSNTFGYIVCDETGNYHFDPANNTKGGE